MTSLTAGFSPAGVSDGDTIAVANAGDLTAWDNVATSGGNTLTYSNTHAHSASLAAKAVTNGSGGNTLLVWNAAFPDMTDTYGRIYIYMTAYPSGGELRLLGFYDASITIAAAIRVQTDGTLFVHDHSLSSPGMSSTSLALNAWNRIEWRVQSSASNGIVTVRIYSSDPDAASGSYDEQVIYSGSKNTSTETSYVNIGGESGSSVTGTFWYDDIVAAATTWPGPQGATAPVADFTGTPLSGTSPLSVAFSDLSTHTPTSWLWEKSSNGGATWGTFSTGSTQQNPTETFT